MTDTLTKLPPTITAGDSLAFTISLSDYLASAGWSLSYVLLNASGKINLSSTADGDDHSVSIVAAVTADYSPGDYKYTSFATNGTERHTVESGNVTILPDPAAQTTFDGRSHAELCLENINSILEGKATADNFSYSISGRSLSKYSWEELITARNYYRAEVAAEKRNAAGKSSNRILVSF